MSESASWGPPYLLYLGNAQDDLAAKTARGLAYWRPEWCVGQVRGPHCKTSVGLPDLDVEQAQAAGARTLLVGVANAGGVMDGDTVAAVLAAMEAGLHVASGLHQRLAEEPRIREAADRLGRVLFDARRPPALEVGKAVPRAGKRLLTVGTDCSVGKMYTTLALERELRLRNIAADFRATGQTGIFIAGGHGVPIDAVVADFISGGAEWVSPARDDGGWDLIEGQGSLFHPSFAGVSLGLLHGAQPHALVLCHEPTRQHMRGLPHYTLPALEECLAANLQAARLTSPGVQVAGIAVDTSRLSREHAASLCSHVEKRFGLPCQDPVADGVARIADRLLELYPPA